MVSVVPSDTIGSANLPSAVRQPSLQEASKSTDIPVPHGSGSAPSATAPHDSTSRVHRRQQPPASSTTQPSANAPELNTKRTNSFRQAEPNVRAPTPEGLFNIDQLVPYMCSYLWH